jgi:hypothetical protein
LRSLDAGRVSLLVANTSPFPAVDIYRRRQRREPAMGEVIAFRPRAAGAPSAAPQDRERSTASVVRREFASPHQAPTSARDPLWRDVVGRVLRDERHRQGRTLAQVAGRAGMSVQYLSEMERGRKDASSEMLAAACGSLGLGLAEFARRSAEVSSQASAPTGPVLLAA